MQIETYTLVKTDEDIPQHLEEMARIYTRVTPDWEGDSYGPNRRRFWNVEYVGPNPEFCVMQPPFSDDGEPVEPHWWDAYDFRVHLDDTYGETVVRFKGFPELIEDANPTTLGMMVRVVLQIVE